MRRNSRKMPAKVKEQLAEDRRAANREKDTVYWLVFLPIHGIVTPSNEEAQRFVARFAIQLLGNPKNNPEFIEKAIGQFEAERGVKSWKELAVSYRIEALYEG